jgi:hypothetical protein
MVADFAFARKQRELAEEKARPDYVLTVDTEGKVFIQCNRPMIPARAVELAVLLKKVAGGEGA